MQAIENDLNASAATELGVRVVDVRIRQADLPPETQERVYERMRSERQQVAGRIRAEGERDAAIIRATARPGSPSGSAVKAKANAPASSPRLRPRSGIRRVLPLDARLRHGARRRHADRGAAGQRLLPLHAAAAGRGLSDGNRQPAIVGGALLRLRFGALPTVNCRLPTALFGPLRSQLMRAFCPPLPSLLSPPRRWRNRACRRRASPI